jgi:oligopeptide transport system substrate-binding protein
MKKRMTILLGLLVMASMILSACGQEVVTVTVIEGGEVVVITATPEVSDPVTLTFNWGTEPPTADPSLATDTTSVDFTENTFMGLTRFDPITGAVLPWLAETWEVSDDGTIYTFHLRTDIPWVRYDTGTGEVEKMEIVDAHDVEYGVKRTIDPATASDYSYVLYIIKNAQAVNEGEEGFTLDDVGVTALDDTTVQFELENPAGFFPAIAGMWVARPVHQATIEAAGDRWTEPGTIVTNGPYVMTEWVHGSELNLAINPHWPGAADIQIEVLHGVMITEASTAFALYENNELDTTGVPLPEVDRVLADPVLSAEYNNFAVPCTYYYGITNNKPPMDDVRVRTAFSMSVDKVSIVENVMKGGQIPAGHFAPPGIFGAPVPGTVGLDYDPTAAAASLQEYLDEKGMTLEEFNALGVTLMHNTSEGHARIAAAIQQMWLENLGVEVRVENQEWKVYLQTLVNTTPLEDMPHIWRLGWCADYPDENNWVYEVFNADAGANRLRRGCVDDVCTETTLSRFDELTAQASSEADPAVRIELYFEAEQLLSEVEVAYIPIYFYASMNVTKPWLTRDFPLLGGANFWEWEIDWDAKSAATN